MGTTGLIALLALAQASAAPVQTPPVETPPVQSPPALPAASPAPATPATCDARPWRHLVGRAFNEVLTVRLPAGTRIYRVDDPPASAEARRGRLAVEIGRNTRVRRVYCG